MHFFRSHWAIVALWFIAALWTSLTIRLRPDVCLSEQFLFADGGYNLLAAREILSGKLPYRDFAFTYGPLAAYIPAAFAKVFGNSAQSYLGFTLVFASVNLALLLTILSRVLTGWRMFLFTLVIMFPVFLMPRVFNYGFFFSAYHSIEPTVLLVALLLWNPIWKRTARNAFALGLILGAMQWVKFGTCFVFGAAIIVVDFASVLRAGCTKAMFMKWITTYVFIAIGFLILEGALVSICAMLLPHPIAADTLWPSYMLQNYAGSFASDQRHPQWGGMAMFLTQQLGPLASIVLVLLTAFWYVTSRMSPCPHGDADRAGVFLIAGSLYIIGLFTIFAHVWLIYGFVWILALAGAYAVSILRPTWAVLALASWSFCLAVNVKSLNSRFLPPGVAYRELPNGQRLWITEKTQREVRELDAFMKFGQGTSTQPNKTRFLMFPGLGGLYVYLRLPLPIRTDWLLPGLVRPYDEAEMISVLPSLSGVVVWSSDRANSPITASPATWTQTPQSSLGPAFSKKLEEKMGEAIQIDEQFWMIPIRTGRQPLNGGSAE